MHLKIDGAYHRPASAQIEMLLRREWKQHRTKGENDRKTKSNEYCE